MQYLKPLCSHPKPHGIFSKYIYQNHCASFATCKPYAWNPLVLLKKVYALTTLNWLDEFDDPQLARQLYTEAFPLVDITIVPDDEIMQHRRIALLELIQKHIRDRDLIGMVDRITTLLVRGFTNDSQLQTLFNYLLQCGDTSRFTRFIQEIAERSPLQKERLMTIAERLRQEGHQIGWQEGKLEGLQEGMHEQAIKIALRMLEQGFDRDLVLAATQLSEADLAANNH